MKQFIKAERANCKIKMAIQGQFMGVLQFNDWG